MISLILTFFIISPFIIINDKDVDSQYLTLASSLSYSYATLGILGLIFVFLKITFVPLFFILTIIFLLCLTKKFYRKKLFYLFERFFEEIKFVNNLENYKKTLKYFYFILFLLLIVSVGPINHSDTANVYVGYPYKFFINNSHFIDGNLNQGLMGIGDFANIFYFQEKTTWLIRTSQFLPLILLFFYMLKRKISNIYFFVFLTSPVFIQWLTIGKNNFLSETCLALCFLVWEKKKDKAYLPHLFSTIFIAISFKISAILISIPIILYVLFFYINKGFIFNFKNLFRNFSLPLIFSFFILIAIISYRYFLINNPFYPLFSTYFNPGNQQLLDWEETLRTWDRAGFFPLWLFIPKTFGKIAFVLGPANLYIIIISAFYFFRKFIPNNAKLNVGLYQLILLLLFSQGRADYYMAPLILVSLGSPSLFKKDFKLIGQKFNKVLRSSLVLVFFVQFSMFLISTLYSIALVSYVIFDYEAGMNKTAYNYYNSQKINKSAELPVLSEITGMTHLFFDGPFIANQKFDRCFYYDKTIPENQRYKICMIREGARTIIVKKDKLNKNNSFVCKSENLIRASRNIFLEKKLEVDFCKLK